MSATEDTSTYYSTPELGSEPSPITSSYTQPKNFLLGAGRLGFDDNPISQLYEPPHDQQCVLSLDGGGIRGYSILIILRELMREVKDIETASISPDLRERHSSYHPENYIPCIDNKSSNCAGRNTRDSVSAESRRSEPAEFQCGECCRFLPCHYFDYVGGTSTGGLISIMLGRLRMSIDKCIDAYQKLAGDIFEHPRLVSIRGPIFWPRDKYDGRIIQRAVEEVVNRRMSKSEREIGAGNFNSPPGLCRTLVFAYASKIFDDVSEYRSSEARKTGDVEGSAPYIFRSYDHWGATPPNINERNPGIAHSIPIWEAARATTAAPFYFEPIKISNRMFGDGGFGTNNPAEEMVWEVTHMNGSDLKNHGIALLLSIGTGESDIVRLGDGPIGKYRAYFNAAKKLAGDSRQVHERLEGYKRPIKLPYFRFNVPLKYGLGDMKLDEWKKPNPLKGRKMGTLDTIEEKTTAYCNERNVRQSLRDVAQILVDHRKNRASLDIWGLISSGKQYRCTVEGCRRVQQLRPRREDLVEHLKQRHNLRDPKLEETIKAGICPPE